MALRRTMHAHIKILIRNFRVPMHDSPQCRKSNSLLHKLLNKVMAKDQKLKNKLLIKLGNNFYKIIGI